MSNRVVFSARMNKHVTKLVSGQEVSSVFEFQVGHSNYDHLQSEINLDFFYLSLKYHNYQQSQQKLGTFLENKMYCKNQC